MKKTLLEQALEESTKQLEALPKDTQLAVIVKGHKQGNDVGVQVGLLARNQDDTWRVASDFGFTKDAGVTVQGTAIRVIKRKEGK